MNLANPQDFLENAFLKENLAIISLFWARKRAYNEYSSTLSIGPFDSSQTYLTILFHYQHSVTDFQFTNFNRKILSKIIEHKTKLKQKKNY